jgi:aminoglycoside phosphotransferase family enzyme
LKLCRNDSDFLKDSEVRYYAQDYVHVPDAPIPACYAAQFSTETDAYYILMEDLSETHEKDAQPTLQFGKSVARAVAKLHAHGWGEEKIKALGGGIRDRRALDRYVEHISQGLNGTLEAIGGGPRTDVEIIKAVFARLPAKLLERIGDPNGFAIVHGDLNPGNILYPKAGGGKVYFLDRQPFKWSLTTWLAVSDLAYMMVPFWEPRARRELERPVLKEYHEQLLANGVQEYSWDQLLMDYRLAAMQSFFVASEWNIKVDDRERMRSLWTAELDRALEAYADLNCRDLL